MWIMQNLVMVYAANVVHKPETLGAHHHAEL